MKKEYKSEEDFIKDNNWRGIIKLVTERFLLFYKADIRKSQIIININFYFENNSLGEVVVDRDNLEDLEEFSSTLEYWILTRITLPERSKVAYNIYKAFTEYTDNIFYTQRKQVSTGFSIDGAIDDYWHQRESFVQNYELNLTSRYLFKYSLRDLTIYKSLAEVTYPIKVYSLTENPEVLTRKIIFDLYENGY